LPFKGETIRKGKRLDNQRWVNNQNGWYAATFSCPVGEERIWWKMEGIG
jgi:hypothetical protein